MEAQVIGQRQNLYSTYNKVHLLIAVPKDQINVSESFGNGALFFVTLAVRYTLMLIKNMKEGKIAEVFPDNLCTSLYSSVNLANY